MQRDGCTAQSMQHMPPKSGVTAWRALPGSPRIHHTFGFESDFAYHAFKNRLLLSRVLWPSYVVSPSRSCDPFLTRLDSLGSWLSVDGGDLQTGLLWKSQQGSSQPSRVTLRSLTLVVSFTITYCTFPSSAWIPGDILHWSLQEAPRDTRVWYRLKAKYGADTGHYLGGTTDCRSG